MAKKAERKAREEQARLVSGVPVKTNVVVPPAGVTDSKAQKKALRAARPAKAAAPAGEGAGET